MSEVTEAPAPAREGRYPLAFDGNGNPIDVPEGAIAWRVRRGGGRRGRPSHVFDSETGRQLEIPLGASIDALIEAGCPADRYLLYPVDAEGRVIPGIVAVTAVSEAEPDDDAPRAAVADASTSQLAVLARVCEQQMQTIQRFGEYLCRGFESAAAGYGPLRPMTKPAPVVVEAPAPEPPSSGFKPEQMMELMQVAKVVFDMVKGSVGAGASNGPSNP